MKYLKTIIISGAMAGAEIAIANIAKIAINKKKKHINVNNADKITVQNEIDDIIKYGEILKQKKKYTFISYEDKIIMHVIKDNKYYDVTNQIIIKML